MKPTDGGDRIERRTWLKGMAAGVAGAVAAGEMPAAAAEVTNAAADQNASATVAPRFLDDHLRRTLTSLAERLVPGSVSAGVVDIIDTVASVDGAARQRQLLNAISRFDQDAQADRGTRWIDLPEAGQLELLRRASATPAAPHFTFLRNAVFNAYLTTEQGRKEFGDVGRNAWRELPGCTHADPAHE